MLQSPVISALRWNRVSWDSRLMKINWSTCIYCIIEVLFRYYVVPKLMTITRKYDLEAHTFIGERNALIWFIKAFFDFLSFPTFVVAFVRQIGAWFLSSLIVCLGVVLWCYAMEAAFNLSVAFDQGNPSLTYGQHGWKQIYWKFTSLNSLIII